MHILHDSTLTDDNRDKFSYLAGRYSQLVEFHNVENEKRCADVFAQLRNYFPQASERSFTIAAFYRCIIPFVLSESIENAIYLDGDTIVNLDINEIWDINLSNKVCGVVTVFSVRGHCKTALCSDGLVNTEDYFNSGVLFMNLKILRGEKETLKNSIKFIGENYPRYGKLPDEDVLNYAFAARTLKLPKKYNSYLSSKEESSQPIKSQVYHYAGKSRLLNLNKNLNYNKLWMSYFIRTPFFDEEVIYYLRDAFDKIYSDLQIFAAKTSAAVSGKTRAFFVESSKIELLKKFFLIRDDEVIIPAENEESIQKLIDLMKIIRGKYVFFIMTEKFLKKNFPFDLLTNEGFVEGVDFVKGWNYLDTPLNSHSLIKAM